MFALVTSSPRSWGEPIVLPELTREVRPVLPADMHGHVFEAVVCARRAADSATRPEAIRSPTVKPVASSTCVATYPPDRPTAAATFASEIGSKHPALDNGERIADEGALARCFECPSPQRPFHSNAAMPLGRLGDEIASAASFRASVQRVLLAS